MGIQLRNIWVAAGDLETLQIEIDRTRAELVQAVCEALAAGLHAEEVARTAGLSVGELMDLLRTPPTPSAAVGPGAARPGA